MRLIVFSRSGKFGCEVVSFVTLQNFLGRGPYLSTAARVNMVRRGVFGFAFARDDGLFCLLQENRRAERDGYHGMARKLAVDCSWREMEFRGG